MSGIAKKLMVRMIIAALIVLAVGLAGIVKLKKDMINENAAMLLNTKTRLLEQRIVEKMKAGSAALVATLATTPELPDLFVIKDHVSLRYYLEKIPHQFKELTEHKNIRLNAFDAEGNILMRSAATEPDSLRGKSAIFRAGFKKVLSGEVASYTGIDYARSGVNLVSLAQVKSKAGKIVGILEFQAGFGSIVKTSAQNDGIFMTQLLLPEVLELYKQGKDNPVLGGYRLAHPTQYKASQEWFASLNIQQIIDRGFDIQNGKAVVMVPLVSSEGKNIGYRLVGMNLDHPELQLMVQRIDTIIIDMLVIVVIMLLVLMAILVYVIRRVVSQPLQQVEQGLQQVVNTGRLNLAVTYQSDDEVGRMVTTLTQVFKQIAHGVSQANQVVAAIGQGDFSKRLTGEFAGDLAELQQGVNASAQSVSFMMDELTKVMQGLSAGRFDIKMDERVAPAFRQQVDQAMHDVCSVIADISRVMVQMEQGYLTHRVEVDCHGDLLKLKNCINNTLDAIGGALTDFGHVMVNQTTGSIEAVPRIDQKGEVGMVQNAMTLSMTNIASMITEVRTSLEQAVHGVMQVNHSIGNISGQMQQQASALEQSSATAEEMQRQAQSMQVQANDVASLMQQMQAHVETTRHVMAGTVEAMQTIQQKSQQIESIVAMIDGIAFQTNLLALNAAVEAARAGEHGRGFAVVAGEVRSLAQKTADAAKDIGQLIVSAVADVARGNEQVKQTELAVAQVEQGAQQVQERISVMRVSAEQTATGVNELHQAISVLDSAIQENTAGVEAISHTAEHISQQSHSVLGSLSFFKLTNLNGLLDAAVAANDFRYARARRLMRTWALKTEVALLTPNSQPETSTGLTDHFAGIAEMQGRYASIDQKKEHAVAIAKELFDRRDRGVVITDADFGELREAVKTTLAEITAAEQMILSGQVAAQRSLPRLTSR
ncbi:MAG: HAMP domain-containing protein [Gammaproteobacteria bacterium]|nr:HAMP domain-containing protein [Gammaproteobacteria bacterium]